jgi:ketosteroid isomerase-like protein
MEAATATPYLKDGRGVMDATSMLREFCDAVERKDGRRFASLFCEDGVYHDVFYGEFVGQARIAEMINEWFFKSATDMRWDMHDPVCDGKILYARYIFSYKSLLPEAGRKRAMFEGVAIMHLREGRIADYREVANTGPGFVDMNFAPERIVKILSRQGDELKTRPELARHLA